MNVIYIFKTILLYLYLSNLDISSGSIYPYLLYVNTKKVSPLMIY